MEIIIMYLIFGILPMYVAAEIAKSRNRTPLKAAVVAFFLGWIAVLGIWLMLRTRDENGNLK